MKNLSLNSSISALYRISEAAGGAMPLYLARVAAGFPSPADDYIERSLDLNELLVRHPAATYFVRVSGDSMTGAGIYSGDLLIVDRAEQAVSGSVIIACLNGELTVKRFIRNNGGAFLMAENEAYDPIPVTEESGFEVWGVVIHVIRRVR
jgi:DNA polymerase V